MLAAQKRKVSLKGALKTLRQRWTRGTYTDFDELLARTSGVSLEVAQKIRESWEDIGFLAYDKEGLLVWYRNF